MRLLRILGLLTIALIMVLTPTLPVFADVARWEYYNTGYDTMVEIYTPRYYAQTFTTINSHTLDYVKLRLIKENTSGTLTVELMATNSTGWPEGEALVSGTYDGALLSDTVYSWPQIHFTSDIVLAANTTYAIVAHGTGVNNTSCIDWGLDATGPSYTGGQYFESTDGGFTYTNNSAKDFMFEVWGSEALDILDCRAYSSYLQPDDWLVVLSYNNRFEPYYPNYNPKDYFSIDLMKGADLITSYPMQQWGMRPGAIYLSALEATMQEWGNTTYWVRLNGTFVGNPWVGCNLTAEKWKGDDLSDLDDWCMLLAGEMNDYYSPTDSFVVISAISSRQVLSEEAGVYFALGIPALPEVLPDMFTTVIVDLNISEDTMNTSYVGSVNFSAVIGTNLTTAMDNFGTTWFMLPAGEGSQAVFWILNFIVFGLMAGIGVPRGHHMAGLLLGLPILLGGAMLYTVMIIPIGVCVFLILFWGVLRWWRGAS